MRYDLFLTELQLSLMYFPVLNLPEPSKQVPNRWNTSIGTSGKFWFGKIFAQRRTEQKNYLWDILMKIL